MSYSRLILRWSSCSFTIRESAIPIFKVSPDGLRAEVQLIETWTSTVYSASAQQCPGHIPSHQVPQTIFLERKEDVWVVDTETLDSPQSPIWFRVEEPDATTV